MPQLLESPLAAGAGGWLGSGAGSVGASEGGGVSAGGSVVAGGATGGTAAPGFGPKNTEIAAEGALKLPAWSRWIATTACSPLAGAAAVQAQAVPLTRALQTGTLCTYTSTAPAPRRRPGR